MEKGFLVIKPGDRISVHGSEDHLNFATIIAIQPNLISIQWDNFPGKTISYKTEDVLGSWFAHGKKIAAEDLGQCNHKWSTYQGFREEYEYCTKCDKKK